MPGQNRTGAVNALARKCKEHGHTAEQDEVAGSITTAIDMLMGTELLRR